jgi:hypothetical protein
MKSLGGMLVVIGLTLVLVGAVFLIVSKLGFCWRLPGDLLIRRRGLTIYLPVVSMLLLSVILTLVFNLISRR